MSIRIVYDPDAETILGTGAFCPTFFCDVCGTRIGELAHGAYLFKMYNPESGKRVEADHIAIVHKGECLRTICDGRQRMGWDQLDHLLAYLKNNHAAPTGSGGQ
jgi:hypothetical protein